MPDTVAALQAVPLLRPTRGGDPITAARQAFDRIRLIAHRQACGELPAGIDAIRAHATVASLVAIHGHAIMAAAAVAAHRKVIDPSQAAALEQQALSLRDARAPWAAIAVAAERYASGRRSPRLLANEVNTLATRLAELTRDGNGWRAPGELSRDTRSVHRMLNLANRLNSRLPDLAAATNAIADRLYAQRDLFMPTHERDDIDHPYRLAPISDDDFRSLQGLAAHALSRYKLEVGGAQSLRPVLSVSVSLQAGGMHT